jgi:hypothetical protein
VRLIPLYSALSLDFARELRLQDAPERGSVLSKLYISGWDFDEDWYLNQNADLAAAIPSDAFASGWHHFVTIGYFEGRSPIEPYVDSDWYMSHYGDVAAAILDGVFANAREHFEARGRAEGRVPCDPQIDARWYRRCYLNGEAAGRADRKRCTEHFIRYGYLNGALPAPPR